MKRALISIVLSWTVISAAPLAADSEPNDFNESCMASVSASALAPFRTHGFSSPARSSEVAMRSSGIIEQIFVNHGDMVSKGDPLVRLASSGESLALETAEKRLDVLKKRYSSAIALGRNHYIANLEVLDLEVSLAEAHQQLNDMKRNLSDLVLMAPFTGVIENKFVEIGEHVSLGESAIRLTDMSLQKIASSIYMGGNSPLCKKVDKCRVYVGHKGVIHGPFGLDFLVPITQDQRGLFHAGLYTSEVDALGVPVDMYLVPEEKCLPND